MSNIPPDIRKKANDIALAIERTDDHYAWPKIVAAALAEERERCARVADKWQCVVDVAARIRSGKE